MDVTFLYKALHRIIDIDVEPYIDLYKETDHYSFRHNTIQYNTLLALPMWGFSVTMQQR